MRSRTLAKNVSAAVGNEVRVCGFVTSMRNQKQMIFLIMSDETGAIQVVHEKKQNEELTETLLTLTPGSAIEVSGLAVSAPNVRLTGCEIQLQSLTVHSIAESPLPLTRESSLELQMDWRQLSLRWPENALLMRVATTMERAMRAFWHSAGFIDIHSPKLMATASESGAELFKVPYFDGVTATLAQSPQFYKQMAMAAGVSRVFEIGPVFRANPSFTPRHDTEFTSVDMEIAWINSEEDVMSMEERLLHYVLQDLQNTYGEEVEAAFGAKIIVPSIPFPRITLEAARSILASQGHIIGHKEDLDPQGERLLCEYIKKTHGHEFVFVTEYPASVRAFYHMRPDNDHSITKSFDLLWKGVEITTGAQREHRLDRLMQQAAEKGIEAESLKHYFNFFRYGCPPHGGCGIGFTRLLMLLLNRKNVREVTFLYRGPKRLTP